jgi:hypothetical protein
VIYLLTGEDTRAKRVMRSWAPFFVSVPLWVLTLLQILPLDELSPLGWVLLIYWNTVTVDLARGLLQPLWREKRGDAMKGAMAWGVSRKRMQVVGGAIALVLIASSVVGTMLCLSTRSSAHTVTMSRSCWCPQTSEMSPRSIDTQCATKMGSTHVKGSFDVTRASS